MSDNKYRILTGILRVKVRFNVYCFKKFVENNILV